MRLPAATVPDLWHRTAEQSTVPGHRTPLKARRPKLRPKPIGNQLCAQNTITFIFLDRMNDIDFLRRNGEWSERWVVGDIEATIDLDGERHFAGAGGLADAGPANSTA